MNGPSRRLSASPADQRGATRLVGLYCRVSSDEQADAETIEVQRDFLRRYCDLHGLEAVDEYLDDGVSGTVPFAERPGGARLLEDARAGRFDTVLFMRVNRLARRLIVALDAYQALEAIGVAVKSGTEPIDTGDPVGRFVFQLLGAFAELDRETIIDNTTRGRARGAKNGRWYGVVPIGYTVVDGRLTPNDDYIAPGMRESDLVRETFERIAAGSSGVREVVRLTSLDIQPFVRYMTHDGRERLKPIEGDWTLTRITRMIRNPLYKGTRTFRGRHGEISQIVPALVSPELWQRANDQLTENRRLSKRNAVHTYLARGLIRCGRCGSTYRGTFVAKSGRQYYQCGHLSIATPVNADSGPARRRCGGKAIPATWLEQELWMACEVFLRDPGQILEEARRQYLERVQEAASLDERQRVFVERIVAIDKEREAIIRMARRGLLRDDEVESQLGELGRDRDLLKEQRDAILALQAQAELSRREEQSIERLLDRIRSYLSQGVDDATKADILRLLVDHIIVETDGTGPGKSARVRIVYRFPAPEMLEAGPATVDEMRAELRTA